MEQGKGLIVGIDIENTTTQAGIFNYKSQTVQSVNLLPDSREYINPVSLEKIMEGHEDGQPDVDSLVRILTSVIAECMRVTDTSELLSVCITMPVFYMDALNAVRNALERLGVP